MGCMFYAATANARAFRTASCSRPPDFTEITHTAEIRTERHGNRAKCLQRLIRLELPVPMTVALPFDTVRAIAQGRLPDMAALVGVFGDGALVSVRSSSAAQDWGGPGTILNIGMNDAVHERLAETFGRDTADAFYVGFIRAYAVNVMRLEPDGFDGPMTPRLAKSHYEDEMEEAFPQDPATQLSEVLRSMARAWEGHQRAALAAGAGRAARCRARPCGAAHGARAGQGSFRGRRGAVHQFRHRRAAGHRPLSAAGAGARGAVPVRGDVHRDGCPRPRAGG